jgi:hypothetical protein
VLGSYPENPDITQDIISEILWISKNFIYSKSDILIFGSQNYEIRSYNNIWAG